MEKIVFATNNSHKIGELRAMLGADYQVLSLADIDCHDDIPEDADTFEGNALAKARWVAAKYGIRCAADDSGLEVDALGGAPGVFSARFSGVHGDSAANNALLLQKMQGVANRSARFRCVIALVESDGSEHTFSGSVEGTIEHALSGTQGFGYDPLFRPAGWSKTFAEASAEEKNAISHRGRAVEALCRYLDSIKR